MYVVLKKIYDDCWDMPKIIQEGYPVKAVFASFKKADLLAKSKHYMVCEYEVDGDNLVNGRLIKDYCSDD